MVYPAEPRLARVDDRTRAEAKAAIARMQPSGGTAMGTWLTLANTLFDQHPTAIRHALLLTDGRNQSESREQLDRALAACEGRFVCDARGIGEHYEPRELLRIVSVLRGRAAAVRAESELAEDFRQMMAVAMGRTVADVRLRIRTLPGVEVRLLKQAYPTELHLTEHAITVDDRTAEFSTGSWGRESREYHLSLTVEREGRPWNEDLQVAVVDLVVRRPGQVEGRPCGARSPVLVHWTEDLRLSTRIDPRVAHYLGQAELSQAVLAGYDAYGAGDHERAGVEWGRAVRLATESGNGEILARLVRLVEVVDAGAGLVRVRANLRARDLLDAAVSHVVSTMRPDSAADPPRQDAPSGPDRTCVQCGRISPGSAAHCAACGRRLDDEGQPDQAGVGLP
nr:VWA domain-containing protein [Streptoalloteichus tenebrarius]